jgi:adenosylhomocysteine nucleosidase
MSSGIGIVAALPREISALVKGVRPDPELRTRGVHLYRLPGVVVVAAGMGSERAAHAVGAALASGEVSLLISTGLAGSCSSEVKPGEVVEAATIVDANTGERFSAEASAEGRVLVTAEAIASVREKARLHAAYGAAMVDMEAATVARLARGHGIAFRALKGISDAHDFELESLARFAGRHGSFRTGAFALHTALRPHTWRKAMELGSGSQQALAALGLALRRCIGNGAG